MNSYEKAVECGIEMGLDRHFSKKKLKTFRLSEKGAHKILDAIKMTSDDGREEYVDLELDEQILDLEPNDIKGAIVLTISEAEELATVMFVYHEFYKKFMGGLDDDFLFKASMLSHKLLDKRIKQT